MYLFIYYNKWGTFSCSACVCGGQASECISHIFKWIFMQRLREMSCCLTESQTNDRMSETAAGKPKEMEWVQRALLTEAHTIGGFLGIFQMGWGGFFRD